MLLILVVLLGLAGCSTWSGDRLEEATVDAIDDRLRTGMALDEFRREFPDAVPVSDDDDLSEWLVLTQKVCFLCTTADGFRRSRDTYARIVQFEQDRLMSVNPVPQAQAIDQ